MQTTLKNRRSPSGPIADAQLPIYGSNLLTTASTHYFSVGALGDTATEANAQVLIPEAGILRRLIVHPDVVGVAPSFAITYNVRKNGVLIPLATAASTNIATADVEIDINVGVAANDLISVEVVVAAFGGGTSPNLRTTLLWAPGANF
jgi:hypothetical protein